MKKKFLLATLLVLSFVFLFAISVCADDVAVDPYADYYNKVYTAIDGTQLALYEKEGEVNYPLAWFYNNETGEYEEFRVGTEVIFAVSGGTTQIGPGVDFRENASVVFTDTTKTYTLSNLILVNLQGTKTNMFSGSWTNLPIQAIYCNIDFAYVNGGTFSNNKTLTVFDIPKAHSGRSATICGAFNGCISLKEIYIPKSVCVLSSAFQSSGLEKVEFAADYAPKAYIDWQTSAGKEAWFRYCTSLETVILPTTSTHTYIGAYTFDGCTSLETITIPAAFTEVRSTAFNECTSLSSVTFNGSVTELGSSSFKGCTALESITLPSGLITIGTSAFENCSALTSIYIPDGVVTIGNNSFKKCTALTTVSIPAGFVTLGDYAFQNDSLISSLTFRGNAGTNASIGTAAFETCYVIGAVSIPEGVTTINNAAFNHAGVTHLTLPTTLTTVNGGSTFNVWGSKVEKEYKLQSVTGLENTQITTIVASMFRGQSQWKPDLIILPNTVTKISSDYAFADVGMTNIRLSAGLTYLGNEAFTACLNLKNVYVPGTIESYGGNPFYTRGSHFFVTSNNLTYVATFAEKAGVTNTVSITDYNANPDNYKSGKWVIYGLNSCETFYGSHASEGVTGVDKFVGEAYVSNYAHVVACGRNCGKENVTFICGPLFENKGYSKAADSSSFTYGITINDENIAKYVERTKSAVNYGFIIGAVPTAGAIDEIVNADGTTSLEKAVLVNFSDIEYENLTIYNVKMVGIDADQINTSIYCCAYVIDGENVSYMGNAVTEKAVTISAFEIEKIETTTPPAQNENDEQA